MQFFLVLLFHLLPVEPVLASPPSCDAAHPADLAAFADLAEIEEAAGIPDNRRGILAAVWCIESRWTPAGTEPGRGDSGRAWGPMQMHPEHAVACGANPRALNTDDDPRLSLAFSGECWLKRVSALLPRAKQRCPEAAWDVAEAMVSSPFYRWRCRARTSHVKLLEAWQEAD